MSDSNVALVVHPSESFRCDHTFVRLLQCQSIQLRIVPNSEVDRIPRQFDLVFVDAGGEDWSRILPHYIVQSALCHRLVVFGAEPQAFNEKLAIITGLSGVFYRTDSPDIMLKGIGKLLNKESWFKRTSMSSALQEMLRSLGHNRIRQLSQTEKLEMDSLTKREKTIIDLVSSGAQNKEIADRLNISTNTVKTHLYSVFRKTKSRNRVELLTWIQQHQPLRMLG